MEMPILSDEKAYKVYCTHPEYTHNTIRAGSVAKAQQKEDLRLFVKWIEEQIRFQESNNLAVFVSSGYKFYKNWQDLKKLAELEQNHIKR